MSELNIKQIEDKLNSEFAGQGRKLVFWYDNNGEFIEDIKNIRLENAKIHYLTSNNLFKTKLVLEREDKESNYLVYAPFPKPGSRENHLADTIKYSKEFSADKVSLLAADLGIDEKYKPVLEKYIRFFRAKDRERRFYDLEVDRYDENTIEIALLSALAKCKVANFEEVVSTLLTSNQLVDNEYLLEFEKYGLGEAFWRHVGHTLSFVDQEPSLEKLLISLFLTYTEKEIKGDLPSTINKYLLQKSGSVVTFMDQIKNNVLYREKFDALSDNIFAKINGNKLFNDYSVDHIIDLDIFRFVDEKIIKWAIERLLDENLNASIDGMNIPDLCSYRKKKHFGKDYYNEYKALKHGFYIIGQVNYKAEKDLISIIRKYDEEDYQIDGHYRKFYYYLDRVKNKHLFDDLGQLVENIYTNKYLDPVIKEFNRGFSYEKIKDKYKLQRDFYKNFLTNSKDMLVVIISDALRYEVAKDLVKSMEKDKKFDKITIEPQIGVVPSYTSLGMAALLPHQELNIDENYNVFVDGKPCSSLKERNKILTSANPDAGSINYNDLKKYKQDELRDFFVGKSLVYIYHDQIDARAETNDDEVFAACQEAIDEIEELIVRLTDAVSRTNYLVTSDHGFIYKRNKITEAEKIDRFFVKEDKINKRFIVSDKDYEEMGTKTMRVSDVLGNHDTRTITVSMTSNIFKTAGGGQNYVHGGSSPQEVLVPVVQVKTIRGYKETRNVKIALISMLSKITSLFIHLDFIQQEPISDLVNPATYKISFIDDLGEVISNEEIHVANSREKESAKRIFKMKFNLKNQKYSREKKYYLLALDAETGIEAFRHEVIIDIVFADGFELDL